MQISSSLCEDDVLDEWRYSVRAWPIELVHCSGANFRDHKLRAKYNSTVVDLSSNRLRQKSRLYKSLIRNAPRVGSVKAKIVLQQLHINLVASEDCCSKNCAQTFPREKIKLLRERMYVGTTFQFRSHLKLDVHRQSRTESNRRKIVTLEGVDVCHEAWRHIMVVPESTFYRYAKHAAENMVAQMRGNTGLRKPRPHTVQATATLRCILDKSSNHMPRSYSLK